MSKNKKGIISLVVLAVALWTLSLASMSVKETSGAGAATPTPHFVYLPIIEQHVTPFHVTPTPTERPTPDALPLR